MALQYRENEIDEHSHAFVSAVTIGKIGGRISFLDEVLPPDA
jgi:hypothetical protein